MRILLFGGFLGSGKTTTILQVAKYITENKHETVALIENEIGEAGIDDKLFADSGLQVRPLFGGCVCCQITSDLVSSVREINDTIKPDWLIIEMTGLAIPGNIAKLIHEYCNFYTGFKTVTIVDMGRWPELKEVLGPLVTGQVEKTDFVIVNKADIEEANRQEIVEDIRQIVQNVPIKVASAANQLPPAVIEEVIHFG
ncbi:GTP-binding protein [Sporomusa acidovorans]|uniref:CobW/HypB/UreG nucleotide-binding domain-containing protein n=1 Tax=Sporomusa acidovorans (strain ATCC 49682 / DSM 3132 / Mol) TaxID=1123286 RepID=A0ABZ3J4H9_SPOA4|nr:GTP-binding protein [Sporomusa acidovorans]OZC16370.1 putative GTP-binding protein YjiA [Sporomusa acidovorans DSM 3132]SDF00672.1 CobW/HypB/UreG, nucleotide-binding domain [Sporomusa acidovorans]